MKCGKFLVFLVLFLLLLSSCSFNKIFLRPFKYPGSLKEISLNSKHDTLKILFNGVNHQPLFTTHNGRDTSQFDFSIESVMFTAANGDSINGWFLKPKNKKAIATILHCHGNGGSLVYQYRTISPLVEKGFQVFLFDYNGFGFSQGKATRKNALKSSLAALDYLIKRPETKGTKLLVYGQSFGGHLSAVLAEKRQEQIDGLVIEGAFSSAKDIAANRVPIVGRIVVKQGYCAKKSIKRYTKPLLIIHSTEDQTIPFSQGQLLFKKANMPKEFYEIKNCHICGPRFYSNEISAKIKSMLNIAE